LRSKCNSLKNHWNLGPHIIFSFVNLTSRKDSWIGLPVEVKLKDVPKVLKIQNESIYLRGVGFTSLSEQSLTKVTSIGHYKAACDFDSLFGRQLQEVFFSWAGGGGSTSERVY